MATGTPTRPSLPPLHPWLAAALLAAAIAVAYWNSLAAPFVFDDIDSIAGNPSIRRLASAAIWSPPPGLTVSGRPLVNATLALNHAFGGENVRGYHAVNVAIHALAAVVLFGLLRRGLALVRGRAGRGDEAAWLALGAALLWALHPLQTESVTYVIQRAESLVGLFFLLALYAFIRGATGDLPETAPQPARGDVAGQRLTADDPRHPESRIRNLSLRAAPSNPLGYTTGKPTGRGWLALSAGSCLLGMATKEVMVSAPLAVLLCDRALVATSFRDAWRRRRGFYLALAATWLLLAFLAWQAGDRSGTAGFSAGVPPWKYALSQGGAILHYLRLALWPHPLVFDYGPYVAARGLDLLPAAAVVVGLLGATFLLWRRSPPAALAGAIFFLALAPSSSFVPIETEAMAEHRVYLPLAALAGLAAVALSRLGTRRAVMALLVCAIGCGLLTRQRNEAYRSDRALWTATVDAAPQNPRAHFALATSLAADGNAAAAEEQFRQALALRPDYVAAARSLGALLSDRGRFPEAILQFESVLRAHPADFVALNGAGLASFQQGRMEAAKGYLERAVRADSGSALAHNNLGCVCFELGDLAAARTHEETALRLKPDYAEAHYNLGNTLARQNQLVAARESYARALRLVPDYAEAHINLAVVLQNLHEVPAAIGHYREGLRLQPDNAVAKKNLEQLLQAAPLR